MATKLYMGESALALVKKFNELVEEVSSTKVSGDYLSLSGGTMTGDITFGSTGDYMLRSTNSMNYIKFPDDEVGLYIQGSYGLYLEGDEVIINGARNDSNIELNQGGITISATEGTKIEGQQGKTYIDVGVNNNGIVMATTDQPIILNSTDGVYIDSGYGNTLEVTEEGIVAEGLIYANAPTNVSGTEQVTAWFNTANGGRVGFGKEKNNSGTGIFFDQVSGTRRLNFRASATAGAMVWEQPESGSSLYYDVSKINFRNSATIQFQQFANAGYLYTDSSGYLKKGTMPTKLSAFTNDSGFLTAHQDISGKLNLSGGTMTGPLKWASSTALPENTSPKYLVTIDAFGEGGTTKWVSLANLKSTLGVPTTYAGSSSAGGSATSAVKLDTATAGSATQPVYFSGGKPVATTYTLGASVPSGAKFTDTTYSIASPSAAGLVKPVGIYTKPTINSVTSTAGRYYHVQMSSDGNMFVNVPWSSSTSSGSTPTLTTVAANTAVTLNTTGLYIGHCTSTSFTINGNSVTLGRIFFFYINAANIGYYVYGLNGDFTKYAANSFSSYGGLQLKNTTSWQYAKIAG